MYPIRSESWRTICSSPTTGQNDIRRTLRIFTDKGVMTLRHEVECCKGFVFETRDPDVIEAIRQSLMAELARLEATPFLVSLREEVQDA